MYGVCPFGTPAYGAECMEIEDFAVDQPGNNVEEYCIITCAGSSI